MRTRYKFIRFQDWGSSWACLASQTQEILGEVYYYGTWDRYVFEPTNAFQAIHSAQCLKDIADFLDQLDGTDATR